MKFVVHIERAPSNATTFTQNVGSLAEAVLASEEEHERVWGVRGTTIFAQLILPDVRMYYTEPGKPT